MALEGAGEYDLRGGVAEGWRRGREAKLEG